LGLAVLLTVASGFDSQLGVDGFRYAFLASALFGALGLVLTRLIPGERAPPIEVDVVTTVAQVQPGRRER
jgi:hypothetical protein